MDILAQFCFDYNVDEIKMINLPFLVNSQAFQDEKQFEKINETIEELKEYNKSMLIIDIDTLIGTQISESSSSMGPSISKSISNSKMFSYFMDLAKSITVSKDPKFWFFIVSQEEYIIKLITQALQTRMSQEEEKIFREEEEKAKKTTKCVRCQKNFVEKDNRSPDVCHYHYEYMIHKEDKTDIRDLSKENDKFHIQQASHENVSNEMINSLSIDLKEFDIDDENEKQEGSNENPYLYICCWKKFGEDGCENGYHSTDRAAFDIEKDKNFKKMRASRQFFNI